MSNGKITPAIGKAADAIQAEIKAHPTFDPQPFGAMGTFPLGATMFDLARAAFRSLDVEDIARTLASFHGDEWLFGPPIIDGVTREANSSQEWYRRCAAELVSSFLGDES